MTPGVQSLSHEQYLAAPGVSSSMLKIIGEKTPLHLKCAMDSPSDEPTPAQRFGTLVHRSIFEPDTMEGAFHVRPEGMNFATKEGKAWKAEHGELPILTEGEAATILAMVASVHAHPVAAKLLKCAEFERSCFVEDKAGTLRKFRPDIWPAGGNVLPDLKTCVSASLDDVEKAIYEYGYFRQAAYYLDGAKLLGRDFDAFAFIFVEKMPPFAVAIYSLDPLAIDAGRMLYQRDLQIYRNCIESNVWPGYDTAIRCASVPAWAQKRLEIT